MHTTTDQRNKLNARVRPAPLVLKNRTFAWGHRTYIMGVVNVTPDSFSGDGTVDAQASADKVNALIAEGADIIDIGAESTRPGHVPVDEQTEIDRVLPVLESVRNSAASISLDTRSATVFQRAADCGAEIFNSVADFDDAMFAAAAASSATIVITHNHFNDHYSDIMDSVLNYFDIKIRVAEKFGITAQRIILDPGIGFGKLPEHNISILKSLDRMTSLGCATLIGTSRKSTLGKITGRPADQRSYATAATVAIAIAAGIDIIRVHDVADMGDVARMSDAIVRNWRPDGFLNS